MFRRITLTAGLTLAFLLQGVHPAGAVVAGVSRGQAQRGAVAYLRADVHEGVAQAFKLGTCRGGPHVGRCVVTEYGIAVAGIGGSWTLHARVSVVRRGEWLVASEAAFAGSVRIRARGGGA